MAGYRHPSQGRRSGPTAVPAGGSDGGGSLDGGPVVPARPRVPQSWAVAPRTRLSRKGPGERWDRHVPSASERYALLRQVHERALSALGPDGDFSSEESGNPSLTDPRVVAASQSRRHGSPQGGISRAGASHGAITRYATPAAPAAREGRRVDGATEPVTALPPIPGGPAHRAWWSSTAPRCVLAGGVGRPPDRSPPAPSGYRPQGGAVPAAAATRAARRWRYAGWRSATAAGGTTRAAPRTCGAGEGRWPVRGRALGSVEGAHVSPRPRRARPAQAARAQWGEHGDSR